jgi:hypothetical protein
MRFIQGRPDFFRYPLLVRIGAVAPILNELTLIGPGCAAMPQRAHFLSLPAGFPGNGLAVPAG